MSNQGVAACRSVARIDADETRIARIETLRDADHADRTGRRDADYAD
jgi:hypothetical protein